MEKAETPQLEGGTNEASQQLPAERSNDTQKQQEGQTTKAVKVPPESENDNDQSAPSKSAMKEKPKILVHTLSDRNLKQKISHEDVGTKTKSGLLDVTAHSEPRVKDDLFIARRASFKEKELEREKAVEKKALRAFVRKKKDKDKKDKKDKRKDKEKDKEKDTPAVPEFVGALKDEHIEDNILYFSDASFLSPMFLSPMTLSNQTWLTCMHYYLAHKAVPGSSMERKFHYANAQELRKLDKHVKPDDVRKDWNEIRVQVMKDINMAKFTINDMLGKKLLKTGDMLLVYREDDKYLGNGDRTKNQFGLGQNKMGEILMWVRGELQKQSEPAQDQASSAVPTPSNEQPAQDTTADHNTQQLSDDTKSSESSAQQSDSKENGNDPAQPETQPEPQPEQTAGESNSKGKSKQDPNNEEKVTNVLAALPASSAARLAPPPKNAIPPVTRRRPQRGHHGKIPAVAPGCLFGKEEFKMTEDDVTSESEESPAKKPVIPKGGPPLGFGVLPIGPPSTLRRGSAYTPRQEEEQKATSKEDNNSHENAAKGENGSADVSAVPPPSEPEKKKGLFAGFLKKSLPSPFKKSENSTSDETKQAVSEPAGASSVGSPRKGDDATEKIQPKASEESNVSHLAALRKTSYVRPKSPTGSTPVLRASSGALAFRKTLRGGTIRDADSAKRLIHCKGKRKVRTRLVEVHAKSLNHGDSFVLDVGTTVFVWNGAKSNFNEKAKALAVASIIKNHERASSTPIVNIDSSSPKQAEEFWLALQGQINDVATIDDGGDDAEAEKNWPLSISLFKLTPDSNGNVEVQECTNTAGSPPSRDVLSTTSIVVLDSETEFYVWVGKAITEEQRTHAESKAKELLSAKAGRPAWVALEWVADENEPLLFREKFAEWPEASKPALSSSLNSFLRKPTDSSPPTILHRGTQNSDASKEEEVPVPEGPLVEYPLEQLQAYLKSKPPGVYINVARIEDHLAAEEFQRVFKMEKDEFYKLPGWKRSQKKKEAGLF